MKLRDSKGRFISKVRAHIIELQKQGVIFTNELIITRKNYKVTGSIINNDNTK